MLARNVSVAIIGKDGRVKIRHAPLLAWSLTVLILIMFVTYLGLAPSRPPRVPAGITDFDLAYVLSNVPFVVFACVGGLIAARRPQSPIGWLFVAIGFFFLFPLFASDYALRALYIDPGSLPAAGLMSWGVTWTWFAGIGTIVLAILLFPNGELLSRHWRPVAWLVAANTTLACVAVGAFLWPYRGLRLLAWDQNKAIAPPALTVLNIAFPILMVGILAAAFHLVLRYRRARGEERQQLKWVAYGAGLMAATAVVGYATGFDDDSLFLVVVNTVGILALPVTTGVAVLKYRLYDIDRLINRTLVYIVLTAALGLSYFALVAGISSVAGESSLTVAGATLAVSALFQPLRRRIQAFIDRRFYRSKYNAEQTLADFSAKLRDDIDLDHLTTEMAAVVHDTLQPAHFSLWLRTP
jgi:hypothetical protein